MSLARQGLNWPIGAAWALATCGLWLIATINRGQLAWMPSHLFNAVLFTQLVTVAVRWPYLVHARIDDRASTEDERSDSQYHAMNAWPRYRLAGDDFDWQLCWLLAWTSLLHAVATACLVGGLAFSASMCVWCLALECLLSPAAPRGWRTWLGSRLATQTATIGVSACESRSIEAEQDESTGPWLRMSMQGSLPDGTPFLTGWLLYELAAEQKSASLTIAFSPPFREPPEVELDQESIEDDSSTSVSDSLAEVAAEEMQCEVEHSTPVGMRVTIKRRQAGVSVRGKLHWQATATEPSPANLPATPLP